MKLLLVLAIVLTASVAWGAEPISVSLENGNSYWSWTKGTGEQATEFRFKCGTAPGQYSIFKTIPNPTPPPVTYSSPVKGIVPGVGIYWCVLVAANPSLPAGYQESPPTNEVNFRALAINAPTGLEFR